MKYLETHKNKKLCINCSSKYRILNFSSHWIN